MFPPKQSFAQRSQAIQQSSMNGQSAQSNMPSGLQNAAQQQQQNQDAPMGDPIDTIAQMLGLDLSSAASPDQQGQMVVSAVESLVTNLHQYAQQYGYLPGQEPDDSQMGADGDELENYEDDGNEGSYPGTGEGVGEAPVDSTQADEDGVDEDDSMNDSQEPTPPPAKKKGVAASFDFYDVQQPITKRVLQIAGNARQEKIKSLTSQGYITPATAKELSHRFCNVNSLSLSLSMDSSEPDDFDSVCSMFIKNGPVVRFGELSASQSLDEKQFRTLSQSHDGDDVPENSPLVKAAEERANKVSRQRQRAAQQ